MSMQIGSIIMIAVATAVIASSTDLGGIQAPVYVGAALLLIVSLPIITRMPEHHGSW